MVCISILAGGPMRNGNRRRHLEIKKNKVVIAHVLDACQHKSDKILVVINNKNIRLHNYIQQNYPLVEIIPSEDEKMLTTFKHAFKYNDDTLFLAGDLHCITSENIDLFLKSKSSCIHKTLTPWGKDLKSKSGLIRRGDVGYAVVKINKDDIQSFLSLENITKAKEYYYDFNQKKLNENLGNHVWTWMCYSFFFKISSERNIPSQYNLLTIKNSIFNDND